MSISISAQDLLRTSRVRESLALRNTLTPFDLHCSLLATDTLIPIDVVTCLLDKADSGSDGVWTLEGLVGFYEKLAIYYTALDGQEEKGIKRIRANWAGLVTSRDFHFSFLFVIAGVMFVLGAFLFNMLPSQAISNMFLVGAVMYLINAARTAYNHPAGLFKHDKVVNDAKRRFKFGILELAARKQNENKRTNRKRLMRDEILLSYIRGTVIHNSDLRVQLSKRDLELLLVKELGQITSSAIREAIWTDINPKNSKSMSGQELYKYITSKDVEYSRLQRIQSVMWACLTSIGYWMNGCFFVAAAISASLNVIAQVDADAQIPWQSLTHTKNWLYLIGMSGFSYISYKNKSDLFEIKEESKVILKEFISDPGQSNHWIDDLYADLNADDGLDKVKLNTILQRCGICLPEKDIESLFYEIGEGSRGILSKHQIDAFVKKKTHNKYLALMIICLKSFDFWAMQTWLWGCLNFILAGYFPNAYGGQFAIANVQIGSILFLLGGVNICWSQYIQQSDLRHYRFQFYEALSELALDHLLAEVISQDSRDLPVRTIKRQASQRSISVGHDDDDGAPLSTSQHTKEPFMPIANRWNSNQYFRGSSILEEIGEIAPEVKQNLTKVLSQKTLIRQKISSERDIAETAGWSGVVTLREERSQDDEEQPLDEDADLSNSLEAKLDDVSIIYTPR